MKNCVDRLKEVVEQGDVEVLVQYPATRRRLVQSELEEALSTAIERGNAQFVQALSDLANLNSLLRQLQTSTSNFVLRAVQLCTNVDVLECLIQNGFKLDLIDNTGSTSLHRAAVTGHAKCVRLLCRAGVDCTAKNLDLDSPLAIAVRNGMPEAVSAMLETQLEGCQHRDGDGNPLLSLAVQQQSIHMVKILCKAGCDPCLLDWEGQSALIRAINTDQWEIVQYLCQYQPDCVNCPDPRNATPLIIAAQKGKYNYVKKLISCGASINARDISGMTALMLCWPSKDLVDLLLESGANANLTDTYGAHALWRAVYSNQREVIPTLVQANSSLTVQASVEFTVPQETVLELAFRKGYLDVARLLMLSNQDAKLLNRLINKFSFDSPFINKEKGLAFLVRVLQWTHSVPSLKYLCRGAIRQTLGCEHAREKLYQLPLPDILLRYIDLADLVENFMSSTQDIVPRQHKCHIDESTYL